MLGDMFWKYCVPSLAGIALCSVASAGTGGQGAPEKESAGQTMKRPAAEAWSHLPVPKLGYRVEDRAPLASSGTFIWVHVPEIPGSVLDLWCYEHNSILSRRSLEGGALELRHRSTENPNVLVLTTVTPEPGAVELVARVEVDQERDPGGKLPDKMPELNLCVQPRRVYTEGGFSNFPDPFPEFISRCFIFTDKGRTFLADTVRRPLPRIADQPKDPRNNPPWLQVYGPVWEPVSEPSTGNTWYNRSPDRFTIPILGVVTRDRKHLAALANDTSDSVCQAWAPCLHNNPNWTPKDAPPAQRRWRTKLYIMPNDPELLLKRVAEDMPNAFKLQEKRVPADG